MAEKIVFTETQHFRQIWLWILLLAVSGMLVVGSIKQVYFAEKFGVNPTSNIELIALTLMMLCILLLFVMMRLETTIDEIGIHYRFYPFHRKIRTIQWERITKAYTRKYSPIGEYGDWGIRFGIFGRGNALNVSGNKGLQLIYDNNKKLLIGTQKPNEIETIIHQLDKLK